MSDIHYHRTSVTEARVAVQTAIETDQSFEKVLSQDYPELSSLGRASMLAEMSDQFATFSDWTWH